MPTDRSTVIAGEVRCLVNELGSLSPSLLRKVYTQVGPGRWRRLTKLLYAAADKRASIERTLR